jgi:hypothetical protein
MPATSTGPVGRSESDGAVGVAQGKTAAGQARMTPQPIALVEESKQERTERRHVRLTAIVRLFTQGRPFARSNSTAMSIDKLIDWIESTLESRRPVLPGFR